MMSINHDVHTSPVISLLVVLGCLRGMTGRLREGRVPVCREGRMCLFVERCRVVCCCRNRHTDVDTIVGTLPLKKEKPTMFTEIT